MSSCSWISEMFTLLRERFAGGSVIRMGFWCAESGVTQEKAMPSGAVATAAMLHKPWCSVDLRNIRHTVRGMRP